MKRERVQSDNLVVVSLTKSSGSHQLQSNLKALRKSNLVELLGQAVVTHVDNITKRNLTLFDTKAITHIFSGKYKMRKKEGITSLQDDFEAADKALDSALEDSESSIQMIRKMSNRVDTIAERARKTLEDSAKIS